MIKVFAELRLKLAGQGLVKQNRGLDFPGGCGYNSGVSNTPETARRAVTEALAEKGITLEMVQPLERMQPSQVYMFRHYRQE